jgi:integrase
MVQIVGRLSALKVARLQRPGMHPDGAGLYLQVSARGARSWILRYTLGGRTREMGLGALADVSLAEARKRAAEARKLCGEGIDPIEARNAARRAERIAAASAVTFADCAASYVEAHKAGWRNAKHAAQWSATLRTYACPKLGKLAIQAVDTGLVLKVLEPIWRVKPETASRLRGRIEAVIDWATARGYRTGENPARWRGHLAKLLPARAKLRAVRHHPALPYAELPAFMAALRAQEGTAARALEFAILTAARTGEVVGARVEEIDRKEQVWTVPAARMKAGRAHRVPLSRSALAALEGVWRPEGAAFLFPGHKPGKHLSNMAMLALLKRMGRADLTVHGFRSTFRDWAAERTGHPREVVEMALAHSIGDKVEAAYRRGDLFDKRRTLMNDWARYCGISATVVRPAARKAS